MKKYLLLVTNRSEAKNSDPGYSITKPAQTRKMLVLISLLVLMFLSNLRMQAQFCMTPTSTVGLVPTTITQTTSVFSTGAICFTFNATSGCDYAFATCNLSTADTYLRLYSGIGGVLIVSADDNCGAQSSFLWTCPTTGVYSILMNNYSCSSLNSSTSMSYSTSCAGALCSGSPNSGVASISSATGCPNAAFSLNASGLTSASGLTYQWQSSTSGSGPFVNVSGATVVGYNTSTTTTTYYRMITTCTASGLSGTTSVVSYSIVNPGPCVCNAYAASNIYYAGDEEILNVAFGTMANASSCASTGPGPGSVNSLYSNYTGFIAAPNICPGATVPFTVAVGTCGGWYGVSMAIYIDYNQNGSFTDSGELAYSNTTYSASATNYIGSVVIPTNAVVGTTRMRVITLEGTGAIPASSGLVYTWGETEDYCVNVLPMPTVIASGGSVCPGAPFTSTPTGAVSYTFAGPTTTVNNVTTATLTPIVNTTYTISGTGSNGCRSYGNNSATVTVNVLASPIITLVASPSAYCNGGASTITATGANTYTWNTTAQTTSIAVNPTTTTMYTVTGTGTNICNGVTTITLTVNPIPTIAIAASALTVCSMAPVNFTASGASTYTWNGTVNSTTASFSPTNATTYTVVGTTTAGCVSSTTIAIATKTLPVMMISPPAATICATYPLSLTASGAVTYTWSNNAITSTVTVFQTSNTTYTVTGTNTLGCNSSTTIAVSTLTLPIIVVTPSVTTVCASSPASFSAAGAVTYTWSNATSGSTATYNPTGPTQYSVVGTNTQGCNSAGFGIALTNPLPSVSIVPSSATVCANTTLVLNATTSGSSYTWSPGGAGTNSIVVNPSVTTVYTIASTETVNSCVGKNTVTVTVNPLPVLVIVKSSTAICINQSYTLNASGAGANGLYNWSDGQFGTNISITPTVTGTYTLSAIDSIGCAASKTISLIVNPLPVIAVSPASKAICVGESVSFLASGAVSYTWMPGNTNGSVLTVSPTSSALYNISGVDANNCQNQTSVVLTVNQCTGIDKINAGDKLVRLYPNPSTGLFTATFEAEGAKTLVLYNSVGQVIQTIQTNNTSYDFDLSTYSKGIYFVIVKTAAFSGNYKMIIE